jgi:hypothetical protein
MGLAAQVYVVANLAIALGYVAVPALVLPHLPLRRRTIAFGVLFFVGCFGSHADMIWDVLHGSHHHPPVGWFAVGWHVAQAVGTWGFILLFRAELAAAQAALTRVEAEDAPTASVRDVVDDG